MYIMPFIVLATTCFTIGFLLGRAIYKNNK